MIKIHSWWLANFLVTASYGMMPCRKFPFRAVRRDFRRTALETRVVDQPLSTIWKNTIALRHPFDIANVSTTIGASIAHIFRRLENRRIIESTPLICLGRPYM